MLESDTFRQIDAIAPNGQKWCYQHDLASAHTAKVTQELLKKENAHMAPRMPSGADLNPLGNPGPIWRGSLI